jgi:protein-tyrosine-phosphatase
VNVIFVCTGNTCRSPLAEAIARQMAADRGLTDVIFTSAGIAAGVGAPATDAAVLIGIERGLDLSRHRSRPFNESMIGDDTLVLGLSTTHVPAVRALVPKARVHLLDDYATRGASNESVTDPFGGDLMEYRIAADHIESMLAGALDRIAAEQLARGR